MTREKKLEPISKKFMKANRTFKEGELIKKAYGKAETKNLNNGTKKIL